MPLQQHPPHTTREYSPTGLGPIISPTNSTDEPRFQSESHTHTQRGQPSAYSPTHRGDSPLSVTSSELARYARTPPPEGPSWLTSSPGLGSSSSSSSSCTSFDSDSELSSDTEDELARNKQGGYGAGYSNTSVRICIRFLLQL